LKGFATIAGLHCNVPQRYNKTTQLEFGSEDKGVNTGCTWKERNRYAFRIKH
jgi:hypothetical protein